MNPVRALKRSLCEVAVSTPAGASWTVFCGGRLASFSVACLSDGRISKGDGDIADGCDPVELPEGSVLVERTGGMAMLVSWLRDEDWAGYDEARQRVMEASYPRHMSWFCDMSLHVSTPVLEPLLSLWEAVFRARRPGLPPLERWVSIGFAVPKTKSTDGGMDVPVYRSGALELSEPAVPYRAALEVFHVIRGEPEPHLLSANRPVLFGRVKVVALTEGAAEPQPLAGEPKEPHGWDSHRGAPIFVVSWPDEANTIAVYVDDERVHSIPTKDFAASQSKQLAFLVNPRYC